MLANFSDETYTYAQWEDLRKAKREKAIKLIVQKLIGIFLIAAPFFVAWVTHTDDVSVSVILIPVGVALIFTRKMVLDI